MEIKQDFDFNDLRRNCWSGAEDTLKTIEEYGMEDKLMGFLECYFEGNESIPTLTQVNDLLWFEEEYIFEQIGLELESEEDEEEEEE